jgi:hypothetical protein
MSAQININRNEVHLPNLAPNKAKVTEYGFRSNSLSQAAKEARKTFSPDSE